MPTDQDQRFESRLLQPYTVRWLAPTVAIAFVYAILRYNVFSGVEWVHFPLFITNKALALAAVFLIALSYLLGKFKSIGKDNPRKKLILIKSCGVMGFALASMHAFAGLLLMSPLYYAKFYADDGRLNLTGELSLMFGVFALATLSIAAVASLPFMYDAIGPQRWRRAQSTGYWTLALACGHLIVMGRENWLDPASWPGSMPPVSLVALTAAMTALVTKGVSVLAGPKSQ